MVPIGAVTPQTEAGLRSLMMQDYKSYRVILITETDHEEAADLVRALCGQYPHASHVVAGTADRCAQKNHNLLAGVATLTPEERVLVFCDSTHIARPDFLSRLVRPIAADQAQLASGYRFVVPGDDRWGTLLQKLYMQSIHMLYALKPLSQPWGGATAITRSAFLDNRIPDLWSRTVVDDYSMGPYLARLGIRSLPVAEACMETHIADQSLCGASDWFYRQMQFFKFYTPLTWVAASVLPLLYLGMILLMAASLAIPSAPGDRTATILYLCILAAISPWYTGVIPSRTGPVRRAIAFLLFNLLAPLQLLRTWLSNTISWQAYDYRMGLGGEILEIVRREKEGPV
jgi:hypothetical protein